MKKIIFLALLLGVGYFATRMGGSPDANPLTNVLQKISTLLPNSGVTSSESSEQKVTIYKYQDKNGQWHYNSQRDTDNKNQIVESYDLNANVITSVQPRAETSKDLSATPNSSEEDEISANPFTVYTQPGKIKKLIQDAKSIQNTLENRKQTLDQQIDAQ